MKRIFLYIIILLASVSALDAQNLDPTVEVRRAYEGKLLEAHKPPIGMTVPDSLMRFDLDFDYSVFNNPYKGSYEFNPYKLAMAPARSSQKPGRFHLRAGAGYELHPVMDLAWSAVQKDKFRMDIHSTHRSFIGGYREIAPLLHSDGTVPELFKLAKTGKRIHGHDLLSEAGVDMRYDWNRGRLDFGAAYYGVTQKDWNRKRNYDALDVALGVSSKSDRDQYFMYDVRAAYRFAEDKISKAGKHWQGEHNFEFDALIGQVFGPAGSLLFDVGVDLASYHGVVNATVGKFHIVPHYKISRGWWLFDLGVRVSALVPGQGCQFKAEDQYVYPDVTISINPIKDAMKVYFHAGGGSTINKMSSIIRHDAHYSVIDGNIIDNTIESFSGVLGIEGRISTRFGYHLRGGYVQYRNAFLDAVSFVHDAEGFVSAPILEYASYRRWFVGLDWNWKAESVEFKGNAIYNGLLGLDAGQVGFAPAAFQGDVSITYNWKKRLYIGADCQLAGKRVGGVRYIDPAAVESVRTAVLPGYADLGLNFEYAFNRKLSLWARAGNLLNQTILRSPLYAEGGINFIAGICLNF